MPNLFTGSLLAQVDLGRDIPLGNGTNIAGKYTDFGTIVTLILKNGLTLAGIILLVLILAGGVMYIAAAGSDDQKKLAAASSTITSALIGFLVIFLSYFIIQIIQVLTGLQIL
jgi:Zn-dependent protease with chaperone function